ncbi:RNA 2',3'-cyclic phosphodiesterase [Tropicimonas sp. IMCC34043]|uniref:RNA 2',3'-cyclic phosphodiesterase n=1 Tax=Tropicimonas sp. IMCC34043 TaxID=2248760 RepID=UPI0013006F87|nr:RNA 2',3'-cyclic phosphodiesterase [Tropicimonas sp. IMCC34043]
MAISLTDSLTDALAELQAEIPVGRLTPPENLHLTLNFLGELRDPQVVEAHEALEAIRAKPVRIELTGLDLLGAGRPQALHATIRSTEPLLALQRKVTQALRSAGLDLPRQRYHPHITLARFNRQPQGLEATGLAAFLQANAVAALPGFMAEAITLFRSDLGIGGAVHSELGCYPLVP